MKKLAIHAIAVLLCVVLSAGALHAQAVYGSIVGTVADSSGAVLAGAKITITDVGRDVTTITTTNESGNYTQRALIVGKYRLRVEAPGFKTVIQDNVGVSVDTESRVDFHMEVGEVTQTLEVTGEASVLKTERSDVATTWSEKTVTNIPT